MNFHDQLGQVKLSNPGLLGFFGQKQSDYLKKQDISGFGLSELIVGSGEQNVKNET